MGTQKHKKFYRKKEDGVLPTMLSRGFENEAVAFFNKAGTAPRYQRGLNAFIRTLKTSGLYRSKVIRCWPIDPTSQAASAFELITATSDITYVNAPVWSTSGVTLDAATDQSYMLTTADPTVIGLLVNSAFACARIINETIGLEGINACLIGAGSGTNARQEITCFPGVTTIVGKSWSNISGQRATNSSTDQYHGTWIVSRISSTDIKLYKDGVQHATSSTTHTGTLATGFPYAIGAYNNVGTPDTFTGGTMQFAAVGLGLTAAEALILSDAVSALQTAWGR